MDVEMVCAVCPPFGDLLPFVQEFGGKGIDIHTHVLKINSYSLIAADQYGCQLVGVGDADKVRAVLYEGLVILIVDYPCLTTQHLGQQGPDAQEFHLS